MLLIFKRICALLRSCNMRFRLLFTTNPYRVSQKSTFCTEGIVRLYILISARNHSFYSLISKCEAKKASIRPYLHSMGVNGHLHAKHFLVYLEELPERTTNPLQKRMIKVSKGEAREANPYRNLRVIIAEHKIFVHLYNRNMQLAIL